MSADWLVTLTFDVHPSDETINTWKHQLTALDGSVTVHANHGVEVTIHEPGDLVMLDAVRQSEDQIGSVVPAEPVGLEVAREDDGHHRADAPKTPELMSAAEIATELHVSRQRVHQLRGLAAFPLPLADLRSGAVWDAAEVRKFAQVWERKPGRPRTRVDKNRAS